MPNATEWNQRYESRPVWSGKVNPTLETCVESLDVGTALDVGCGEGADVVWLASRGWRVRGVDFSREALARASVAAERAGVAAHCDWIQADLSVWTTNRPYDLVTCHFLHEEPAVRGRAWKSAAAAVAPGGTLLIVGHSPEESDELPGPHRSVRFTAEQIVAELSFAPDWDVEPRSVPRTPKNASAPDAADGGPTRIDVVLTATRAR